jgi:menaquinone-dependent protoporphyrinogen oxidase
MRIAIFFATREGHTLRLAEHLASEIGKRGVDADLYDLRTRRSPIDWSRYSAACLAASVHGGQHEPEMIAFVKQHRLVLERMAATFLSVSLSEAGAEDATATPERRRQSAADVERMIEVFERQTGWRPSRVMPIAGALKYRRYNFIIRFIMKRIARKAGAPTDTSCDYDFTDWPAVDRFVGELLEEVKAGPAPMKAP